MRLHFIYPYKIGAYINLLNKKEKEKGLARIKEDNIITYLNTNFTSFK